VKTIETETDRFGRARQLYKLGKSAEALAELERLGTGYQGDRDVLELRWALYAGQDQWPTCVDIARRLTLQRPDDAHGWLCLADSVRNVPGGTLQMSYDILVSAARQIRDPILLLTLGRYSAQLGRVEEMREWIDKAHEEGDASILNGEIRIQ